MHPAGEIFTAQNSIGAYLTDFFYIFSCAGGFIGMLALALIDGGTVRREQLTDAFVLKLVCIFAAGTACLSAGYGIWNWQYEQAYGVPHALWQSLSGWWLGGTYLTRYAENIDPAAVPGADEQQIFVVFLFTYAGLIGAFIHSMGVERIKPLPCIILSVIAGGLLMPLLAYATWGPVGPLTNRGLHDFVGAYSLYMFVGTWSLILSWRLGPRAAGSAPFNPVLVGSGVMLLMIAILFFVIGCGLLVPGQGYYGITNVDAGLGLVFVNIAAAFGGGTLVAAWIGYRLQRPLFIIFGPIAGYIGCTALFDIAAPWQCLLIGAASPLIMLAGEWAVQRAGIDDPKIAPVALGPAIFSALMAGIIGQGIPTGGLPGLTGAYGFQHAHISLAMQLLGTVLTLTFSAVSCFVLVMLLEKSIGLRTGGT